MLKPFNFSRIRFHFMIYTRRYRGLKVNEKGHRNLYCTVLHCSPVVYGDISKQVEGYDVRELEGVSIGVDVGYRNSNLKNRQYAEEFIFGSGSLSLVGDTLVQIKHSRWTPEVSVNVGYSHFFENWYLGVSGEVALGENNKKFVVLDEGFSTESRISGFSGSIKFKGGYYFKDWNAVIYGIAGLRLRKAEMQYDYDNKTVSVKGSKAKLSSPLCVVGVGIERPIYKKLSFSAEYEYAWGKSRDTFSMNVNNIPVCFYVKQSLEEHSFKIGVKYHI